jgi:ATP-dependent DNA helicase RecG
MAENPKISIAEIAETIGLSIKGVEKNIRQLKKEGTITRTTDTKNGEWIVSVTPTSMEKSRRISKGKILRNK